MAISQIKNLGQFGCIKDQPAQDLPPNAWSHVMNARFRDGCVERIAGDQQIFTTPTTTPLWLQAYNQMDKRFWVHAGTNKVFADDGSTRADITPAVAPTGTQDDRWNGGVLNGVLVANNGKDAPWSWGGSGVMIPVTNWPVAQRAKVIRPYKNYLVGLDVTKNVGTTSDRFRHMVMWSTEAEPGKLPTSYSTTDPAKNSGELDIAEEPSLMVDMLPLGDANIIYKENAMFAMSPSGDSFVFRFQRLPGSVGALSQNCIANTPQGHVVLTHGDVIIHSGQGPRSIIDSRMRRWIFNQIDSEKLKRSFVAVNPAANEVLVCFPTLGSIWPNMAAVWNWATDTWGARELQNATCGCIGQVDYASASSWNQDNSPWDDDVTAWNQDEYSPAQSRLLLAGAAPIISAVGVSSTMNGTAFSTVAERIGMDFDAPDQVKTVRGMRPRIDATPGVQVQIQLGGQMDVEQPIQWSAPITYTVGQTFQADGFASGRWIGVRYQSIGNQPFRVRSHGIDVVGAGSY